MRTLYLNRAIAEGAIKEMERDENVLLMGEDMLNRGGGMSIFLGAPQAFPDRCLDMPISELAFTHFGIGMALAGKRPIIDLMFSDFATIPSDAIINNAAKMRFNSLGEVSVPAIFIMGNGGRGTYDGVGSGCNHSQCAEAWFMNVPGLKIVAPYYPSDACGLLRSSIRDNDPIIFLYHEGSLGVREEVADEIDPIPLNNAAKIMREGTDVTIVALQSMVPLAVKAVEELEKRGVSAELIDPRVYVPFDKKKVCDSVAKTGKLLIVQEAHSRGGIGSEFVAQVAQELGGDMKKVKILGALNSPIGSGFSEAYIMPHTEDIVACAEQLIK